MAWKWKWYRWWWIWIAHFKILCKPKHIGITKRRNASGGGGGGVGAQTPLKSTSEQGKEVESLIR
jgi:hypothetical protein